MWLDVVGCSKDVGVSTTNDFSILLMQWPFEHTFAEQDESNDDLYGYGELNWRNYLI
jgi:hypothetical protein